MDANVITNSANAAKALSELSANLPNNGGIVSWFTGDNDIATFGTQLVSFGQSFASYYASVSTVGTAKLSAVVNEFRNLVDLANGIKSVDTSGMATFSKNLTALGNSGIDGFINAFTNATSRVTEAAKGMLTTFISGANAKQSDLTTTFTNLVQAVIKVLTSKNQEFNTVAQTLMLGIGHEDLLDRFYAGTLSKLEGRALREWILKHKDRAFEVNGYNAYTHSPEHENGYEV